MNQIRFRVVIVFVLPVLWITLSGFLGCNLLETKSQNEVWEQTLGCHTLSEGQFIAVHAKDAVGANWSDKLTVTFVSNGEGQGKRSYLNLGALAADLTKPAAGPGTTACFVREVRSGGR